MELPASITALGEQLRGPGEIEPAQTLFCDAEVFAAERARIFTRPWTALDHETRLEADGQYFRCDTSPRPVIVTRASEGRLHALRNVCIHAGYPVCEAEQGEAERLICPYHGWEFALDGRLVEPDLSARIDPARLRLTEYPIHVLSGLIVVDLSGNAADKQSAPPLPAWLAAARVVRRARCGTTWNWKFVLHFLKSSPRLFSDDPPQISIAIGPLSWIDAWSRRAVLLRVVPRFAEQTDFHIIEMATESAPGEIPAAAVPDAVAQALRHTEPCVRWFDRRFADWYWSMMSPTQ
ncbi:MAG: Rieske (2Fe-2S) protein [Alphaproteobacteria bacterium]|nr:Rieske (2Fe-2S) protein [Alphaproteobacteria bacterium]